MAAIGVLDEVGDVVMPIDGAEWQDVSTMRATCATLSCYSPAPLVSELVVDKVTLKVLLGLEGVGLGVVLGFVVLPTAAGVVGMGCCNSSTW